MTERYSPGPTAGLPLVLLAGDGQDSTRWLKNLLEGAGYAVLQERSAHHALERARSTDPDVLLVDQVLPDMAGVELCRALRSDPRVSSSTPILLSLQDPATRAERLAALRAGAWECIAPPHDADEILLKIGAYVHAKLDADRARAEGLLDSATRLYNRQGLARRARELGAQAYRDHGALACVVLAFDADVPVVGASQDTPTLARRVQALTSAARLSDAIGRLSSTEFAVIAPGTDAAGARLLRLQDDRRRAAGRQIGPARALWLRGRVERRVRTHRARRSARARRGRGADRARGLGSMVAPLRRRRQHPVRAVGPTSC